MINKLNNISESFDDSIKDDQNLPLTKSLGSKIKEVGQKIKEKAPKVAAKAVTGILLASVTTGAFAGQDPTPVMSDAGIAGAVQSFQTASPDELNAYENSPKFGAMIKAMKNSDNVAEVFSEENIQTFRDTYDFNPSEGVGKLEKTIEARAELAEQVADYVDMKTYIETGERIPDHYREALETTSIDTAIGIAKDLAGQDIKDINELSQKAGNEMNARLATLIEVKDKPVHKAFLKDNKTQNEIGRSEQIDGVNKVLEAEEELLEELRNEIAEGGSAKNTMNKLKQDNGYRTAPKPTAKKLI